MAAVVSTPEQATKLMQNMSLDTKNKSGDTTDVNKKAPVKNYGSGDGKEVTSTPFPAQERAATPYPEYDPNMHYMPNGYVPPTFYYGGSEGSYPADWENYRFVNSDGVEVAPNGGYPDMYHGGFGYPPYGAYPPGSLVPTMGPDGQYYGPQQYQYAAPYYPPSTPASSTYTSTQPPVKPGEVTNSAATDKQLPSAETASNTTNGVANVSSASNGSAHVRPSQQNSSLPISGPNTRGPFSGGFASSGYPDSRFDGVRSPVSWADGPVFPNGNHHLSISNSLSNVVPHVGNMPPQRNQNLRPQSNYMSPRPTSGMPPAASGYANRFIPNNRFYSQFGNMPRTGLGFGAGGYDSKLNPRGWLHLDAKYRPGRRSNGFYGYGNDNIEGLNELNRGPRSGHKNNQKNLGPNVTLAVKGQSLPSIGSETSEISEKDQYNRADFPENYKDAMFFVIKSYSEDDVHKSIKYNIWTSTPNGNKKLDSAFREAKEKAEACPIFLFYSVNASGQFVGVAEMLGPVDFNKTVEYWQQDKWSGCFPVKWHIVKDVPNSLLKRITLENNENKPVTNSRDTQEVKLEQGLEMIKLFKEHISKTSILDDFVFYEARQKQIQEKRVKQKFQKQVWDGKASSAVVAEGRKEEENQPQSMPVSNPGAGSGAVDDKLAESGVSTASEEATTNQANSASEKQVNPNGVANGVVN